MANVIFVKAAVQTDELRKSYKAVDRAGLPCQMVSTEDIISKTEKDSFLYACDPFEGEAFEHLVKLGCRIVGPLCILHCMKRSEPIPKTDSPVYNITMKDCIVSCSSIAKARRTEIHKLVQWMGGVISKNFTDNVTHLVAAEVGSKKYHVAVNLGKPVMLPEWVEASWERSKTRYYIQATDEEFSEFICPPFKGCVVCVTGLDRQKRKDIITLVEENGGTYSGELIQTKCTHLIVDSPTGQKYVFAKKWKIICVTSKWLYDSVAKNTCLDETLYPVEKENGENVEFVRPTSTPKRMSRQVKLSSTDSMGMADISNISVSSVALVNDTVMSLDLTTHTDNMFLDGCKIYLCGFTNEEMDKLQRIINIGGGSRFKQLLPSVSHVVMGPKDKNTIKTITQEKFRLYVVTEQWLVDSYNQGKKLEEKDYECFDTSSLDQDEEHMNSSVVQKKTNEVKEKRSAKEDIDITCVEDDDTTLMEMYLPQNTDEEQIPHPEQNADADVTLEHVPMTTKDGEDDDVTFKNLPDNNDPDDGDETMEPGGGEEVKDEEEEQEEEIMEGGMFSGKSFIIDGFPEEQTAVCVELVEQMGGKVKTDISHDPADYCIVPTIGNYDNLDGTTMVTNCWLQMCMENEEFLPVDSNEFFTPIAIPDDCHPLDGCVLSISQFAGTERECLFHICEYLGAVVQDYFVRKARKGVLANTHLILQEPQGSKYEGALKWKLPAVSKGWILECARVGERVSEADYIVGDARGNIKTRTEKKNMNASAVEKTKPSMAVNDDVKMTSEPSADVDGMSCEAMNTNADVEGVSDEAAVNAVTLSDRRKSGVHCDSNMQVNTNMDKSVVSQNTDISNTAHFSKSRIIVQDNDNGVTEPTPQDVKMSDDTQQETVSHRAKTPVVAPVSFGSATLLCKNDFRPSFDLVCIDTPPGQKAKSQRRRKSSLPLDVMFTNQLKRALERRTNGKTDAINYHHDNNDDDDDEEVFVKQERTGVLNGVIICVSRKLIKKQNEYNNIAAALNAEYLWTYDSRCTHFIHQGRSNDTSKDYKLAKEQKKHIVSPHWLSACKDENKHIDESLYPHTYNPKMSLSVVSKQRRSTRASIKAETTYYSDDDDDNADGGKEDLPQGDTLEIQQDFKRQFDEIMTSALTTKGTRRKSRRLNNSSNSNTGTTTDQDEEISRSSASSREASKTSYHVIAPEHSQTLHITWDDPTGREERQKIMEKLQGGVVNAEHDDNEEDVDEEEEDHHDDNQEDNSLEEPTTPEAPPVRLLLTKPAVALAPEERVYKPPRILLSSMTQQEKIQYGALIEELGGTVSETQYYDRTCTHVVVGSPTRNEKYLAALASGKWVLHKSYLEACRQAEHFIDEYEHEWGNATDLSNRNPQTVKLALAATRWRQRLDEDREASDGGVVGAFKGWKVLLCVDANREAGFKRLLEAGAAQVLCSRPPFTSSEHATHAFLDMGKIRKSKLNVDIAGLVDCGVMCLKAEYIAEYLMVDPLPSAHKYYVDEAREIIQTTNSSEFSAGTPIKRKAVDDEPSESKRSKRY